MGADELIESLGLIPHPEGGWYKETFLSKLKIKNRPISSMIYYLLKEGETSHWHRVTDADEIWNWHLGGTLDLSIYNKYKIIEKIKLGPNLTSGETFQAVVNSGLWQAAQTSKSWALVSCIVTPAFLFESFELAEKEWRPGNE